MQVFPEAIVPTMKPLTKPNLRTRDAVCSLYVKARLGGIDNSLTQRKPA